VTSRRRSVRTPGIDGGRERKIVITGVQQNRSPVLVLGS
jgi:hypothetical protein